MYVNIANTIYVLISRDLDQDSLIHFCVLEWPLPKIDIRAPAIFAGNLFNFFSMINDLSPFTPLSLKINIHLALLSCLSITGDNHWQLIS